MCMCTYMCTVLHVLWQGVWVCDEVTCDEVMCDDGDVRLCDKVMCKV